MNFNKIFNIIYALFKNNILYFILMELDALFIYNMNLKKMDIIFFDNRILHIWQYRKICNYEKKIFLLPSNSDSILSYNIENSNFIKYNILDNITNIIDKNIDIIYNESFALEDSIYLIPQNYLGLIEFNVKTKEFIIHDKWNAEIKNIPMNLGYFSGGYAIDNNYIYLGTYAFCGLVRFNTETKKIELLTDDNSIYCSMCKYGDKLFLTDANTGKIVVKDNETLEDVGKVKYPIEFNKIEGHHYTYFVERNGFIYVFACNGNMIFKINPDDYSTHIVKKFSRQYTRNIMRVFEVGDKIGYFNMAENKVELLDCTTDTFEDLKLQISEDVLSELQQCYYNAESAINESDIFDLEAFEKLVLSKVANLHETGRETVGDVIFETIINGIE